LTSKHRGGVGHGQVGVWGKNNEETYAHPNAVPLRQFL
jgi:hypothetical protein